MCVGVSVSVGVYAHTQCICICICIYIYNMYVCVCVHIGLASDPACQGMPAPMRKFFDSCLAHVRALDAPESEPDYAALRKFVLTAWKSSGFSPATPAKADLDF